MHLLEAGRGEARCAAAVRTVCEPVGGLGVGAKGASCEHVLTLTRTSSRLLLGRNEASRMSNPLSNISCSVHQPTMG